MSRISTPALYAVREASKAALEVVRRQLGVVPDLFRLVGTSPAALSACTSFHGAMSKTLDVKTRERIAPAVAQVNGCDYCLSAHTYLAQEEISLNRTGASGDVTAHAAVQFAATVASTRGHVGGGDIAAVRKGGRSAAQIVEIVALVAENSFTHYLNEVTKTEIDFPAVRAVEAA